MVALAQGRHTPERMGALRAGRCAAAQLIHAGSLVARNAAGDIVKGVTATGLTGIGRAEDRVDNSAGAAGARTVPYKVGIFAFANAPTDLVTIADIGKPCFIVDDQTVAKTDGTGTRSRAGLVEDVDAVGVWVRFDEALTRAA